jgi:dienelactone hydrolase
VTFSRAAVTFAALALTAAAQIPAADSRNTDTPNTDTPVRMPEYRTRADWEKRAAHLRKQILSAAGLYPMFPRTPLRPLVFGRIDNKEYTIDKVALETMPGYWLGGNLYRPVGRPGRLPAIASPHGHWNYGRLEHQPLGSIPARAANFARQGYVVFIYDMVGYNDTVQTPHAFGDRREMLWSFGPLGLQLWNSLRVVDFLATLPEVDPERIGATGASGGGTQTFLLGAVDDRIKFSAPVNMISGIMQGGSPCENAPGLRIGASNLEFGAMMAPRPMLMVSATGDWTRNTPTSEYPQLRNIWGLYDAADKLDNVHVDAPHNYNQASREAVYRFFGKHVLSLANAASLVESRTKVERLPDMLVWHNRTLPAGALDFDGVREQWIRMARGQSEFTRERLELVLGSEWPGEVLASVNGPRLVLSRAGRGDRVVAEQVGSGAPSRIVVHPDGLEAARRALRPGESALLVEVFQTGSVKAERDRSHRHFLTFNKSDDAERVQDLLTALAYVRRRHSVMPRLTGLGDAGVWAVFAVAVAPEKIELTEKPSFSGSDEEFVQRFFVPGIQRAGGWKAALALSAR